MTDYAVQPVPGGKFSVTDEFGLVIDDSFTSADEANNAVDHERRQDAAQESFREWLRTAVRRHELSEDAIMRLVREA